MGSHFITPNWHVILIHYPLGLVTIGVLIELLAVFWLRSTVRNAGRWMILLGTLAMIPTVTTGLYAFNDAARQANPVGDMASWHDVTTGHPWRQVQWDYFKHHIWYEASATGLFVIACLAWLAASEATRRRAHLLFLLLCVAGLGLMAVGAWFSGEDVYRYGSATMQDSVPPGSKAEAQQPGVRHFDNWNQRFDYYGPPLQGHTLMAGLTVAVAVGALGMSLRAMNRPINPDADFDAKLLGDPNAPVTTAADPSAPPPDAAYLAVLRGSAPERVAGVTGAEVVQVTPARLPVGRFWLLATVLGLLTAGGGLWVLSSETGWNPHEMWEHIRGPAKSSIVNRRVVHVALGVSIVVLSLLLSVFGRWTWRRRGIVGLLSLLLVLAIAAQVWMGTLLLFDGMDGPVTRFNRGGTAPTTAPTTSPSTEQRVTSVGEP